jgi:hypothetical protein
MPDLHPPSISEFQPLIVRSRTTRFFGLPGRARQPRTRTENHRSDETISGRNTTQDHHWARLRPADLHRCTDARKTPPGLPLCATFRGGRPIIGGGSLDLQVEEITRDRSLSKRLPAIQKPRGSSHAKTATKNRGCCSLVLETGRRRETGRRAEDRNQGGGRESGVRV